MKIKIILLLFLKRYATKIQTPCVTAHAEML